MPADDSCLLFQISIFVCLVCVVSINSDSAGHYKRRNGLAYGKLVTMIENQ